VTFAVRRPSGFTLIELVITVAIVGVLAAAAIPAAEMAVRRAKESELRASLREVRTAIDKYKQAWDDGRIERTLDATGYPPSLEVLVRGVRDAKSDKGHRIYFLRRLPRDPFSDDAAASPAESWGKRSYRSEPDFPQEGADVYDVYTRSERVGLNGVAYRLW